MPMHFPLPSRKPPTHDTTNAADLKSILTSLLPFLQGFHTNPHPHHDDSTNPNQATPFLMTVMDRGSLRSHLWRFLHPPNYAAHQGAPTVLTLCWWHPHCCPSKAWKFKHIFLRVSLPISILFRMKKKQHIHPPPAMPGISSCAAWCPCRSAQACTKGTNMATSGPLLNIAEAAATGAVTRSCAMRREVFWWPRSRNLGFVWGWGWVLEGMMCNIIHTHTYI